jgi:hypothetical protein
MTTLTADLIGRRLQLLTEMVPGLKRVAVLTNPSDLSQASQIKQAQTTAQSLSVELHVAEAATPDKLESAFATIAAARPQALIVLQSAMLFYQYPRIVAFTAASRLPTLFAERQQVAQAGRPDGLRPEYSSPPETRRDPAETRQRAQRSTLHPPACRSSGAREYERIKRISFGFPIKPAQAG